MIDKKYKAYKIAVPDIKQRVLPRLGIGNIINRASLEEIIYVVAPFGSGKTMAVMSWLYENNKKAAWVTLDNTEDLPVPFWAHLTAAILVFAGDRDKAENIMDDTRFIENPRLFLSETLVRAASLIDEKILVIDGFCNISNKGLLREIKDLISNMLGCWRIIIIGRYELPPIFNDFLLKKHLCLVTLADLNFNSAEIGEYFCMNGLAIKEHEIAQIYEDTDGWPAALNAILMVKHNGTVKFNDTARAYVTGYFDTEIWDTLDDSTKSFMLKTSILDKLTFSICHYVTESENAAHILRDLYTNGLFLSKQEERDTYYYHRVFRAFLLDKLHSSCIDETGLYLKAGWWLYDRDESISALICFYHAKNIQGINMAFKKVKPAYMGMDEYIKATFCLTSLDIESLKSYPEVAVRIALIHFLTDNIAETQRIYRVVRDWLVPGALDISMEEYTDFYWEVGWLRYVNPDEDILFDPDFDNWVNIKEYAPHLLENDRARASTLRLPSILRGVRDFSVNVEKALEFYAVNSATNSSIRDDAGVYVTDIIYAEICYEREDFGQSEKTIKRILPFIIHEGYTELYFACTELLVKITRATHNPNEIDELSLRLKTQIDNSGHFFLLPDFHAFELRNRLLSGVPGMTEVFENENRAYKDKPYYFLIYRYFTYIRALISIEKYNEASLMLGNFDFLLRQYKRNMDLIEANILRSITEYHLAHEADALYHLKTALDDGQKCGFIRIFADYAILLWPVICLINKRDIDTHIRKVIASSKRTLTRAGVSQTYKTAYEPLTEKEIEVLKLLQAGMTNKEIASHSDIKIGTVKAHIHSILSKLNAGSRMFAVLAAQNMGII